VPQLVAPVLRRGALDRRQAAALKWGDVDGASARFRIRPGRYRGVESAPKTAGSVRDVAR